MSSRNVIVVIGGQFGSESKGKHVQDLCHERPEISAVVRTGAPNAGHTMAVWTPNKEYDEKHPENDVQYKAMQVLPCGWTAENVKRLYVGAGAQILSDLLKKEFDVITQHSKASVVVDGKAMMQTQGDAEAEGAAGMSHSIGSTGKGCGAALMRRISRGDPGYMDYAGYLRHMEDTHGVVNGLPEEGDTVALMDKEDGDILVEGTQGCGLSLIHGPYPYTTSRDTHAANWLAEAGLSPLSVREIHMVCRTYPIRVAGNSGPMKDEIDWSFFFGEAGLNQEITGDFVRTKTLYQSRKMDPRTLVREVCTTMEEKHGDAWGPFKEIMEFTTVTKLPRRIGEFDYDQFERNVIINRPTHVALEFCNYVTARDYGIKAVDPLMEHTKLVSGAPIRLGEMDFGRFEEICDQEAHSMLFLRGHVRNMNKILEQHGCGRVTHLGVARDATVVLHY